MEGTMENRRILISGASIAGPTLAWWLHRRGFRPTVVERAPAPRDGGQAVDLRGAAREVADRMGILPAIRRAHTGTRGMALVDAANRRLASMPADLLGDSGGAIAELEILRGDLVGILHAATRDQVEYLFDDAIAGIAQGEDGVEVSFERGPARAFDLVVGADGLHSGVRALAFGEEARFVHDLGGYLATFTTTTRLELDGWELFYSVPGRTVGLYPLTAPGRAKALFYFAAPPQAYDRGDLAEQRRLLAGAFAGQAWEVPRLLAAMGDAPDFYLDRVSQVRMDRWSAGRVALVGDAAHSPSPMSGMGTSLALVGAYVLASELAAAAGEHATALARYEQRLRPYVRHCRQQARAARGFLLPTSRTRIWTRTQFLRLLPHLPGRQRIAGGVQRAANAITLDNDQPGRA
jgi:2-polyprenyl-6-methoxyphenol hydroxylase-like FAD-dependent oxidoreductase